MRNDYCVYKHTSPSGKVYIGITCNDVNKRWKSGYGYKGQGYFWRAIQKHGWNNFEHEILCTGLSEAEAKQKEIELIAQLKSNDSRYGYNATAGGDGCSGYVLSDEARNKISASLTGKKPSDETRRKMSASQLKRFERSPQKPVNEKTRQKMSESAKGRPSPNRGKFGYNNKTSKAVVAYTKSGCFVAKYGSTLEAQRLTGVCYADISKCCNGRRKSAGGYVWRFADDSEKQRVS